MGRISAWQIIILLIFVLLIFGSAKLPEIASSIGKSLKVFKKEVTELRDGVEDSSPEEPGPDTTAGGHTDTSSSSSTTEANPDGPPRT
ncbi:MAG: twin-arginine translocase TatA/TatE family subunit [Actinomycetota bacterium]